ncbi:MAG TPA: hypothetical protein VD948_06740, partial [Rhodothermales bacterium]|nr:hypothetical protein [Rhodothermales bacterium]
MIPTSAKGLGSALLAIGMALSVSAAYGQSLATFGETGYDASNDVALDGSGNAVVIGTFTGTVDFDPGAGVTSRTSNGSRDVFVARYSAAGALVSLITFGGTGPDDSNGVALDGSGNAVVTGFFFGTVDFDPGAGVTSRTSNGSVDVYVARYSAAGALVSVATFGGTAPDASNDVALDGSGNAVVTGSFFGTVDFDPGTGITSRTSNGGLDAFVVRYSAAGALVSVATFGGPGSDVSSGVALDGSGNAVVTGSFFGTVDFDPGAGVTSRTSGEADDAYVARYSAAGALVSVATFSGPGYDAGNDVAVDGSGNAIVTGRFTSTVDFDPGPVFTSRTSSGAEDAFVARYSAAGALVSVITFGGAGS